MQYAYMAWLHSFSRPATGQCPSTKQPPIHARTTVTVRTYSNPLGLNSLTVSGLAYAIFRIEHPTLKSWQLLFLIEGGATCLVALFAWAWLPEGPESAWFLTAEERAFFRRHLVVGEGDKGWTAEYGVDEEPGSRKVNGRYHDGVDDTESQRMLAVSCAGEVDEGGEACARLVTRREIIETARDWKLWLLLVCNICASIPSTAFSVFLPLVVEGMGYSALQANLVRSHVPLSL